MLTFEPVLEVVEPHAGQFLIAVPHDVLDRVEGVMKLQELSLSQRVIKAILGDQVHIVEREVFKLSRDEVIFLGVSGHDVGQVEPVVHHGRAVQTKSEQGYETHYNGGLGFRPQQQRGILLPGKAGQVPLHEGEWDTFTAYPRVLCMQEVPGGAGWHEHLGAIGICGGSGIGRG